MKHSILTLLAQFAVAMPLIAASPEQRILVQHPGVLRLPSGGPGEQAVAETLRQTIQRHGPGNVDTWFETRERLSRAGFETFEASPSLPEAILRARKLNYDRVVTSNIRLGRGRYRATFTVVDVRNATVLARVSRSGRCDPDCFTDEQLPAMIEQLCASVCADGTDPGLIRTRNRRAAGQILAGVSAVTAAALLFAVLAQPDTDTSTPQGDDHAPSRPSMAVEW